MTIETDVLEEFIEYCITNYQENSILADIEPILVIQPGTHSERCEGDFQIEEGLFGTNLERREADQIIMKIANCEQEKYLNGLDEVANLEEDVDAKFGPDLLTTAITCVDYPFRVYLPDVLEYRTVLQSNYHIHNAIPHNNDIPIFWFNQDIMQDMGFVINRGVALSQARQVEKSIVGPDVDASSLSVDHSNNRIIVKISDGDFDYIKIQMRTSFSSPWMIEEDSICRLNLPDRDAVRDANEVF